MAPLVPESCFSHLETAPFDEIFGLLDAFKSDSSPDKVSLAAGVYRDNESRSWKLESVKQASLHMQSNRSTLP